MVAMGYGYDLDERDVLRITVNGSLKRRKH
jgi:hypothetical protein